MEETIVTYGLDSAATLRIAKQICPSLFASLAVAEVLREKLPVESFDALVAAVYSAGVGNRNGYFAKREDFERVFTRGLFPITGRADLTRLLFIAASYSHANAHARNL